MNFLTAAWDLRYIIAGTAILTWVATRYASRAVDDYIDRHVIAALGPLHDNDQPGDAA